MNTGIIILAAGASTRMGQPKQLLEIGKKTMLKTIIEHSLESDCFPVVVVIGANKKQIAHELDAMPITIIDNPRWETGMASSIKMGLVGAYMTFKELDAVIFLTCDQPHINSEIINELIKKAKENPETLAVASQYAEQIGIPALFKRPLFTELLELSGDEGTKKVLLRHDSEINTIAFENAAIDLDTMQEFIDFINS
jgi:molybdenum cofactor cytidylyltransferase